METWVEEIEDWDARAFTGGYAGLRDLADRGFSGAVSTGGTWLFMVNGRVVGVVEYRRTATGDEVRGADVEAFEDADGTAYAAPAPSVPLLVAMKTADGETRGKYYTEDTPIEEVHETLSDGGFTGYLELSENVLSGDYYLVYQGGRASELALVGNAGRLLTGEEAFDRASDEVGIYEVTAVDLDVVDLPAPAAADDEASTDAAGTGTTDDDRTDVGSTDDHPTDASGAAEDRSTTDAGDGAGTADAPADPQADDEAVEREDEPSEAGSAGRPGPGTTVEESDETATETPSTDPSSGDSSRADAPSRDDAPQSADATADERGATPKTARATGDADRSAAEGHPANDRPGGGATPVEGTGSEDERGGGAAGAATDSLVNRSIPSLDPDRSGAGEDRSGGSGRAATETRRGAQQRTRTADRRTDDRRERADRTPELERELEAARATLEELREERDALREERDGLQDRVETLRRRVDDMEAQVEAARTAAAEAGAATGDGPSLSVPEAFAGTNLFVRYESKGALTLEDAHAGEGDPDELAENLVLEHHTQFDGANASVGGQGFEAWLRDTQHYRFVRWLVSELPFEIRNTGAVDAMRDLYDALPEIDRVELDASVEVETEEGIESRPFGLVARDRMGQPLAVADLDGSREPVSEPTMASLVESGTWVCDAEETLSGAFFVASSFFDPDALETAREATSDSLLSRDKRESYVKLSRKHGFHLGLVEARNGAFHLSVPDL